ncbi:MAG: maltotransferase domain-containing protein, partial [Sciscionella sp.]
MTSRLVIDEVRPVVDGGRLPAKAVVGETVAIEATVWREGHDAVCATVVWRGPGDRLPRTQRMTEIGVGIDRFAADIVPDARGQWSFRVDAWGDPWASWRHAVEVKVGAGQGAEELANDLHRGALLLDRVGRRPERRQHRAQLEAASSALRDTERPLGARIALALSAGIDGIMHQFPVRDLLTRGRKYTIYVDRERALYGSWYEFFPRSTGGIDGEGNAVHGTLATATAALDRIAALGFDVAYLPPVHPIGEINRKGPNNSLDPDKHDVGSPWAIGSRHGGHDAIAPELGGFSDFDDFVERAHALGLEVALDLALQCSPDHPWVNEHPEWFSTQPDGSIAYAENPPKRYQDIYPLNFDNDPAGLYAEVLRIVEVWIAHGVTIFRVDNPHT